LFRRILRDENFRHAKLDTGFLDRMLRRAEDKKIDSGAAEVAAIAAGLFAALGVATPSTSNGAAGSSIRAGNGSVSNWKSAGRREALH
jgi:acetyl-CoA carboxylase biotin carboxylase subunit